MLLLFEVVKPVKSYILNFGHGLQTIIRPEIQKNVYNGMQRNNEVREYAKGDEFAGLSLLSKWIGEFGWGVSEMSVELPQMFCAG